MALTRPKIDVLLSQLDGRLVGLRAKYPDDDEFAAAFAGEANVLDENVSAPDTEYLQSRLDDMLRRHGVLVRQDEPPTGG